MFSEDHQKNNFSCEETQECYEFHNHKCETEHLQVSKRNQRDQGSTNHSLFNIQAEEETCKIMKEEDTGISVEEMELELTSLNSEQSKLNPLSKAIKKLKGRCKGLKKKRKRCRKGSYRKKFPGVTFLMPRVKVDEVSLKKKSKKRKIFLDQDAKTKREKERSFRVGLQRAFDLNKVEIISPEKLPVKIDFDLLQKRSNFSTFPVNFMNIAKKHGKNLKDRIVECSDAFFDEEVLLAKNTVNRKRLEFIKMEKGIQKKKKKILQVVLEEQPDRVYSRTVLAMKKSKLVNLEAGYFITSFLDALKDIKDYGEQG